MHHRTLLSDAALVALSLACGRLSPGGAGAAIPSPEAAALRRAFPDQAAPVLEARRAFVSTASGFQARPPGEPAEQDPGRRAPAPCLPRRGEGAISFQLPGGFEARVREIDAAGEGTIAENAVAYARAGGTSFWAATEEAAEEWLLLSAEAVRRDQAVAAWEVEGASLSQRGEAVELADENGVARVRVTAPRAYAARGRPVKARLRVTSTRIELWVDAEGEALLVDPEWTLAGAMHHSRAQHTATLLDDGKVLVAGGVSSMTSSSPEEPCDEPPCKPPEQMSITLSTAEVGEPTTGMWTPVKSMNTTRSGHTATKLNSGHVLVAGGTSEPSAEVFDPATNTWTPVAPMSTARSGHTATKLNSGQVLVAGGKGEPSAEVFDPATDTWTPVAPMSTARSGHTATKLKSGQVLVAGGTSGTSAEVYDPKTEAWMPVGPMKVPRSGHTATLLENGQVLVAGGTSETSATSAEVYDPSTVTWRLVGPMNTARLGHTATLLENGQVLVAGGTSETSAEVYDPKTEAWELRKQPMGAARREHTETLLKDKRVLIAGGKRGTQILDSAELFELKKLGDGCKEASDCPSGFCEDDVCCNILCSAAHCGVCSLRAGASSNGVCTPLTDPECSSYCKDILSRCLTSCTSVRDCAPGYVCNLSQQCVPPSSVQSQRDYSDCSLTPAALLRGRMEPTLLLLAALATLRRRPPRRPARRPA